MVLFSTSYATPMGWFLALCLIAAAVPPLVVFIYQRGLTRGVFWLVQVVVVLATLLVLNDIRNELSIRRIEGDSWPTLGETLWNLTPAERKSYVSKVLFCFVLSSSVTAVWLMVAALNRRKPQGE